MKKAIAGIRSIGEFTLDEKSGKVEKLEKSGMYIKRIRRRTRTNAVRRERRGSKCSCRQSPTCTIRTCSRTPRWLQRDAAVTLVEMIIVLLAYSFWRIRQLTSDITEPYSVYPEDVIKRIRGSILPGHGLKEF